MATQVPINAAYYPAPGYAPSSFAPAQQPYAPHYIRHQRRSRTAPARVATLAAPVRLRSYSGPYKTPRPMFYRTRTTYVQQPRIVLKDNYPQPPPQPPPPQHVPMAQPYPYPYYSYR